ncbi:MAG: aminoacetone oxidase family FAD-binding enzyme [Flavobacteriaceae bacterium]|nr:MAG: aminoacetone oxidase family FAD-binding enzyme [Flavobacteriaceae bacterium]
MKKFVIIGGGAAGFFAAINAAELNPDLDITILEASGHVLQKVKVSGGGRCNVTNACFEPKELIKFYPRGAKELLGPFHQFMTGDTMEWFENHGVPMKIEYDNRVFPEANTSQAIIDCFLEQVEKHNIKVLKKHRVQAVTKNGATFKIKTSEQPFEADYLMIATGSTPKMWDIVENLGHSIVKPVPSLFTFNVQHRLLEGIPGLSVPYASVKVLGQKLEESGPLLITHWGLSGPAVLKLSAWGARSLEEQQYQFDIEVNWISKRKEHVMETLRRFKKTQPKKQVSIRSAFEDVPKRLWVKIVLTANIPDQCQWAQLSNKDLESLTQQLTACKLRVNGKSTFKEEFVTAGGIDLKEINFKRFESKKHENLFFAGEILNIDAITGGFNFQNAWTGGWVVAQSVGSDI